MDYRKDTPLQCTLDGVTVAQCLIFGLFGVDAAFDGDITFHPQRTTLATEVKLTRLNIRGNLFDVELKETTYTVRCGSQNMHTDLSKTVVFRAQNKTFESVN